MKAKDLVEVVLEDGQAAIVIELPNGHKLSTTGWMYGLNKRGEHVIIIEAGRKLTT